MSYGRSAYGAGGSGGGSGGGRRESYTTTNPARRPSYSSSFSSYGSTSGSGRYGSSYGTGSSSGYGTGASSGYSGGGYGGGSGGYGGYDSYSSRPTYGSSYTSSNLYSPYSTPSSYGGGYGSSYRSSSTGRSDYDPYDTGYGGYSSRSRSGRDRSVERTPEYNTSARSSRRSLTKNELPPLPPNLVRKKYPSGSSSSDWSNGLQKSASYSGLNWMRDSSANSSDNENIKKVTDASRFSSHRRNGSNSSLNSIDAIIDSGIERRVAPKRREEKRDLETILGKEDHMLVKRIMEENKDLFRDSQIDLELSPQEKKLVKTISDASITGMDINSLQILQIIESVH